MTHLGRHWLTCLLLVGQAACAGTDGKHDLLTLERFPAERARALCTAQRRCCFASPQLDFDLESCVSSHASGYARWIEGLRADYDPPAAESCIASYRAPCSDLDEAIQLACAKVFHGRQPPHADCMADEECAPSEGQVTRCQRWVEDRPTMASRSWAECIPDDHARANFRSAAAGETCIGQCTYWDGEEHCSGRLAAQGLTAACFEAEGLECIDERCQRLPRPGEACLMNRCDNRDSYCDASEVCRERGAVGSACSADGHCSAGHYCDEVERRCAPLLELGERCGDARQCRSANCAGTCADTRPALCDRGLPSVY